MFQTKVVEKIQTNFLRYIFSRKTCRLWDNVEKCSRTGQATYNNIIRRRGGAIRIPNKEGKDTDTHSYIKLVHNWLIPSGLVKSFMATQQHSQFTYNATFRRVRLTTVAVEKLYLLYIMSVWLTIRAFVPGMQTARAVSYCHMWPVWLYLTFPHYLTHGTIKKSYWTDDVCFDFIHKTFVWNISHSKKNWARYYHKCT